MVLRDRAYQDAVESQAPFNVSQNEVIARFYDQRNGELPGRRAVMVKASLFDFKSLRRYGSDDGQRRRSAQAYAGADGLGLSGIRACTGRDGCQEPLFAGGVIQRPVVLVV